MTPSLRELLDTFDRFPDAEKREAVSEIFRRVHALDFDLPSDDDLVFNAEQMFLELDHREAADGGA